jgi:serine protease Do
MLQALASLALAVLTAEPPRGVALESPRLAPIEVESGRPDPRTSASKVSVLVAGEDGEPSLADLLAFERRVVEVGEKLRLATVGLTVGPNQGSGVIVTEDGIIASAGHLFERAGQRVLVTLSNGRRVGGVTLGYNEREDYGLMRITTKGQWAYLPLHSAASLGRNEPCLAAGHPGGFQSGRSPVLRLGRLIWQRGPFLRTDCAIAMGDSGGPLIDLEGRVIGIHSRIRERLSANYHVDAGKVLRDWERLLAGEVWGAEGGGFPSGPILGVQVEDAPRGPQVRIAYADLPAAKSGIRVGDVILSIDGESVPDTEALLALLAKRRAGQRVKIAIARGEEDLELEVELARGGEERR